MSTPLILAIEKIRDENVLLSVVDILLNFEADPNAKDDNGRTSLFSAIGSENMETIEISFDTNLSNYQGQDSLIELVRRQNDRRDVCQKLLNAGANVNLSDDEGRTALMFLCETGGSCDLLDTLFEHGADINARDNYGQTP